MPNTRPLLFAIALALLALVAGAIWWGGLPAPLLLRDPNAFNQAHPLTGALSTLGVWVWVGSAAICLFAVERARDPGLLRFAGGLSLYLGLDDAFQIHEDLAGRCFGLPEKAVLLVLALATLLYLLRYRRLLLAQSAPWLIAALAGLGGSVVVDQLEPWLWRLGDDNRMLLEDGLKWLGACCWLIYHRDLARAQMR